MTISRKQGFSAGLSTVACWAGFVLVSRIGGQGAVFPRTLWQLDLRWVGGLLLLPLIRHRLWINWHGLGLLPAFILLGETISPQEGWALLITSSGALLASVFLQGPGEDLAGCGQSLIVTFG